MSPISRRRFLAAGLAASAAGCSGGLTPPGSPEPDDRPSAPPALPPRTGPDPLAAGNTAFGLDLYGRLRTAPGNLLLSPFSVSVALAMTAAGAEGDTFAEMAKVLRLPENFAPAFGALLARVNDPRPPEKRGFDLVPANALWAQVGHPGRPEYRQLVTRDFRAGLHDVDFGEAEAARGTINAWVEKETRDKIKELMPVGSIKGDTRLVLTNAIYFKGEWQTKFDKSLTTDQPFQLADGGTVDVPMMSRNGQVAYTATRTSQAVELPYKGGRLGMVVLLPREPAGLPALEESLTGDALAKTVGGMRPLREMWVHLPRFRTESSFNLNAPLQTLGMPTAFDKDRADLSGMADGGRLFIGRVEHKGFVEVNEEGTEAAAATAVDSGAVSGPVEFWADRPFLFLIRDRVTDTVLFLGRVTNPKG